MPNSSLDPSSYYNKDYLAQQYAEAEEDYRRALEDYNEAIRLGLECGATTDNGVKGEGLFPIEENIRTITLSNSSLDPSSYYNKDHFAQRYAKALEDYNEAIRLGLACGAVEDVKTITFKTPWTIRLDESTPELPSSTYQVIVIDPPWKYELRKNDPTHRGKTPYRSMSLQQIKQIDIPSLADRNCTMFLWFTNNHMIEAADLIRHWGFTLKTILTWEKVTKKEPHGSGWGTGYGMPLSTVQSLLEGMLDPSPILRRGAKPPQFCALQEESILASQRSSTAS